jgi:hypothetical protein
MLGLSACLVALVPGTASAAIYWNHVDDLAGEQIARANLDGSNVDPDFIAFPNPGGSFSRLVCEGIAVDATHIYWTENGGGAIGRANLDGSEVNPWFITGLDSPCGLAIDSSHVYWVSTDFIKYDQGSIGRATLNGTDVQPEFLKTDYDPCGLAILGSELFGPRLEPYGEPVGIYRTAANGSGKPELFIPHAQAGCGIAISGEYIYWTDFEGSIGRARLDGAQVDSEFIPKLVRPCGLGIHDGVLYWSEQPEIGDIGAISRANADGTDLRLGIVPNLRGPCGVAVDDTPVPPRPESPNQPVRLSISAVRHLQRTGTILVAVKVSVAGSLDIHLPRQFHARILGGSTQVAAGRSWLRISLSPGSRNSWPRDALRRNGRVRFTLVVGFVPTSGHTIARAKKLQMWR